MKTVLITGACINTGVDIVKKFAAEGWNVVFTGRRHEAVLEAEKAYRTQFPDVKILGYTIDSLLDERTVDEESVDKLFDTLDESGIFVEAVVLNAADQGIGIKALENPLTDFMRVLNTNIVWNFCICEHAVRRMKEHGGGSIVFINSNTGIDYFKSKKLMIGIQHYFYPTVLAVVLNAVLYQVGNGKR